MQINQKKTPTGDKAKSIHAAILKGMSTLIAVYHFSALSFTWQSCDLGLAENTEASLNKLNQREGSLIRSKFAFLKAILSLEH